MTAKIATALHHVMQKCSYVQKNGHNKFHNYRYAGEADLLAVLRPAMVEAGLLLIPSVTQATGPDEYGNTMVRIEFTLAHKDGDVWPEKVVAMGCGNDKNSKGGIGDKGLYKAITGANKYALFKLFQIETGDEPEADDREQEPPARTQAAVTRQPLKNEPSPTNADALRKGITSAETLFDLSNYWREHWPQITALPPDVQADLTKVKDARKAELTKNETLMAG